MKLKVTKTTSNDNDNIRIRFVDLDECEYAGDGHWCSDICINTPGSYQCACPDDKILDVDDHTCRGKMLVSRKRIRLL